MQFHPIGAMPDYEQHWFRERNPVNVTSDVKGIVAWDTENDCIKGMVIFDNWTENSCQVHIAIDTPMVFRHGMMEEGFKYVYETCGRNIIYGITPANNERAIKFNKHAGFVELYRLKDAHAEGVDLIIQEVRKEDYYGQAVSSRAA